MTCTTAITSAAAAAEPEPAQVRASLPIIHVCQAEEENEAQKVVIATLEARLVEMQQEAQGAAQRVAEADGAAAKVAVVIYVNPVAYIHVV